jgi:hypothetical protein
MHQTNETWEGRPRNEGILGILTIDWFIASSFLIVTRVFIRRQRLALVAGLNGIVFVDLFLHDGFIAIFKYADIRIIALFLEQQPSPDQYKGSMPR